MKMEKRKEIIANREKSGEVKADKILKQRINHANGSGSADRQSQTN